ncbi:MAG: TetR/AcrR family transcriptional regulator [Ruminococcaceae bacterium]|nr:TetR/AcrR family transcriptional regulator [Oscillospiraceae bacterium]
MNTKNNKRRRESIEKIEKVFIELLQTQELSEIKVSDICKLAELNRTTFYANFIDIYDLADKIKAHLEADFLELYAYERENKLRNHEFIKLFRHIRDNQLFYKTYFKLGNINYDIVGLDSELAMKDFDMKHIDYHIEFFQAGFNAIVKKWLESGCKESPEEMENILKSEYRRNIQA